MEEFREAVEHGRTGLLVKEGDFVSLAEAIATVLRSPHAFAKWDGSRANLLR